MDILTATESRIIRSMLVKQYGLHSRFLDQLAVGRVADRRMNGVGIFVDLVIAPTAANGDDEINEEISKNYRTILRPPCDTVGFTLFIREGYLSFLEGYTFGDATWPTAPMEDWLVFDRAEQHP